MENISDRYCKKCKNYPFECQRCVMTMPFEESPEGAYISYAPSKFEPKIKGISYENFYNHNTD